MFLGWFFVYYGHPPCSCIGFWGQKIKPQSTYRKSLTIVQRLINVLFQIEMDSSDDDDLVIEDEFAVDADDVSLDFDDLEIGVNDTGSYLQLPIYL